MVNNYKQITIVSKKWVLAAIYKKKYLYYYNSFFLFNSMTQGWTCDNSWKI